MVESCDAGDRGCCGGSSRSAGDAIVHGRLGQQRIEDVGLRW